MRNTRFPTLGYRKLSAREWTFVDLNTCAEIGPRYTTEKELLADIPRFAAARGLAGDGAKEATAPPQHPTVRFTATPAERALIQSIARRAKKLGAELAASWTQQDWEMDIEACHCNGNRLRLKDLYEADDFNFAHDVFGIRNTLNRETGEIRGLFSPRFTVRKGS